MKHDDDTNASDNQGRGPADAAACAQVRELLAAAADLPLDPAQQSHVDSHLAACGPCRMVASWMPRVDAVAARSAPPPAPSERWLQQLRSRVMDQVRADAARPAGQAGDSPLRQRSRAERPGGLRGLWPTWPGFLRTPRALATLAAVALIGVFTYAEIRDRAVGPSEAVTTGALESTDHASVPQRPPSTLGEPSAPAAEPGAATGAPTAPELADRADRAVRADRDQASAPASQKLRSAELAEQQVALSPDPSSSGEDRRQAGSDALATLPPAERETGAAKELEQELSAVAAPAEEQAEPTAAFDRRTSEALADATDSLTASPWDEDRVRGAIALVMQSRPAPDLEAAVGELLLAMEDAPRPTRSFARLAKRQPVSASGALRAPEPSSLNRELGPAAAQSFDARGGVAAKDLVPGRAAAPSPPAPAWSSLPASAAATSVADSAAAALLLRLPELPEGAVRERAVRWLQAHGLR